jgi:hypothetical protein
MANKRIARLQEYARLSDHEKIGIRLAWLEHKAVEVLWTLISLSSMLIGGVVAWVAYKETQSLWIAAPLGLVAFFGASWFAHRRAFRNAPPHIDFIDP